MMDEEWLAGLDTMTGEERWNALGDAMVWQIGEVLGGVENANLTALHLAIADQIMVFINAGVPEESISALLQVTWRKIRDKWGRTSGATHVNPSLVL